MDDPIADFNRWESHPAWGEWIEISGVTATAAEAGVSPRMG